MPVGTSKDIFGKKIFPVSNIFYLAEVSLPVTVDMTEIDSGDCPSNRREGNIFIDKQVQAHSNCSF